MLILNSTSLALDAAIDGGGSAGDVFFVATWSDGTSSAFTPGSTEIQSSGSTHVNVVPAPAASTYRHVKSIVAYNGGANAHAVTLFRVSGGTPQAILCVSLPAGASVDITALYDFYTSSAVSPFLYGLNAANPAVENSGFSAVASGVYLLQGASAFTVALPASPSTGDTVVLLVDNFTNASSYYTLDAGAGVSIAGRTRYLNLIHTNQAVLTWDGTQWVFIAGNLDTVPLDCGSLAVTGATSDPVKGTGGTESCWWSRADHCIRFAYDYNHTVAGSAGSGQYYWGLPGLSGLTINTTVTPANTSNTSLLSCIEQGAFHSSSIYACAFSVYSTTKMRLFLLANTSVFVGSAFQPFSNATYSLSVVASLPIVNW